MGNLETVRNANQKAIYRIRKIFDWLRIIMTSKGNGSRLFLASAVNTNDTSPTQSSIKETGSKIIIPS